MRHEDDYITLAEAAKRVPGKPSRQTIWRWARKGLKMHGHPRPIHLRYIRVGGRAYTTREWLSAFFDQVTEIETQAAGQLGVATSNDADCLPASHARANAELAEAGL